MQALSPFSKELIHFKILSCGIASHANSTHLVNSVIEAISVIIAQRIACHSDKSRSSRFPDSNPEHDRNCWFDIIILVHKVLIILFMWHTEAEAFGVAACVSHRDFI
jgi:hypothetical protein